jgi:hypothetical protein
MAYFHANGNLILTAKDQSIRKSRVGLLPYYASYARLQPLTNRAIKANLDSFYRLRPYSSGSPYWVSEQIGSNILLAENRRDRALAQVHGTLIKVRTGASHPDARMSGDLMEARALLDSADSEVRFWKAVRRAYIHGIR